MEKSGFFKSNERDRIYRTNEIANFFSKIFSNGIFNNGCKVFANDNMTVTVTEGYAFINGYWYHNDSDKILNLELADANQSRVDNIVLRYAAENRSIEVGVVEGNYATVPVAPSLQRNTTCYDLRIAKINIPTGADKITQSLIEDCRFNSDDCGNVVCLIEQIDTSDIFNQYDEVFMNLFKQMKNLLDTDTAGTLQNEINSLSDDIVKNSKNEWEAVNLTDQELNEYTRVSYKYLVNKENKEIFDGKIPHLEEDGEVVKLAEFTTSSYLTKEIEDLNNFKLLIWQCCYKGQYYRVLGSIIGTSEQLKQCNNNGLTWQTTFVGDPTNFMCELYYKSDTELFGRVTGQYCMGVLYGIRK